MFLRTASTIAVTVATICLGGVAISQIKSSGPSPIPSQAGTTRADNQGAATSPASTDKEKTWNSPTMLHARAWVQQYCQASAKITPAEAQQYMDELKNLTPVQMKLWLLRFEAEDEHIKAQQTAFEQHHKAMLSQAMSAEQQTRKAFKEINQGETGAAEHEDQSLATERKSSVEQAEQNMNASALQNPYSIFGYGGGYYPHSGYGGGYHVHYHLHR